MSDNKTTFNGLGNHLSVVEKVGYGLGDTASNILYQAWSFFLMIFYTDVFCIDAKVASFMFLITRVWDMINDPLMGMIADRTNTRWGKYEMPDDIRVDSLNDYQSGKLKRFKDWLYQKRIRARQDRDRTERRAGKEQEVAIKKAERPALFEF